jgi:hypothetical protein
MEKSVLEFFVWQAVEKQFVVPAMFTDVYSRIQVINTQGLDAAKLCWWMKLYFIM